MTTTDDTPRADEFKERVLYEFRRIREDISEMGEKVDKVRNNDITEMKVEIGMLRVKASIGGAVAGAVVGGIVAMLMRLLH